MRNPKYPFGPASRIAIAGSATMSATIDNQETMVDLGTLTAAGTLNLDIDVEVEPGARLTVKAKSDGTARNVTLGTGFLGVSIPGTIDKTKVASFVFYSGQFHLTGIQQLD